MLNRAVTCSARNWELQIVIPRKANWNFQLAFLVRK